MTQDERSRHIQNLEIECTQAKINAQINAAKRASFQQNLNLMTNFIIERTRYEIMAAIFTNKD